MVEEQRLPKRGDRAGEKPQVQVCHRLIDLTFWGSANEFSRTYPPKWFRGRIFNCELKKTSVLKATVPLIARLDEHGLNLRASSANPENKDHSMYVQVSHPNVGTVVC